MKKLILLVLFVLAIQLMFAKTVIINASQGYENQLAQAAAGDTILLSPGKHNRFYIADFEATECNPTVVMSQNPQNPAVIGSDIPGWAAFKIERCKYLIVENIIATEGLSGMDIQFGDHVIVRDCEIKETGQAGLKIRYKSRWIDFVDSKIHHTGQGDAGYGEGIYLGTAKAKGWEPWPTTAGGDANDTISHIWIANNEIYECGNGEGIDFKSDMKYVTVKGNHIHDLRPGADHQTNEAAISIASGRDIPTDQAGEFWIEENTIENIYMTNSVNAHASGICTFGGGHYILNNTIRNCEEALINLHSGYIQYGLVPFYIYLDGNSSQNAWGTEYKYDGGRDSELAAATYYEHPGFDNPNRPQTWCGESGNTPQPTGIIIYADQPTQAQIDAASPGDTLLFEPGTHDPIKLSNIVSTECNPTVLMSLDPSNPATIKSTGSWKTVFIEHCEYLIFENVDIEEGGYGLDIVFSHNIIVRDCEISYTWQEGLKIRNRSSYVDVINNTIHHTGRRDPRYGEAMYIGTASYNSNPDLDCCDSTRNLWIEGNEIYETANGEAIDLKPWVANSTIINNSIHDITLGHPEQSNIGAVTFWSSDVGANNWAIGNQVYDIYFGDGPSDKVGGAAFVSHGGGSHFTGNIIGQVEEAGFVLRDSYNKYQDHYVWDNVFNSTTGVEILKKQIDDNNIKLFAPSYSHPHSAQAWCGTQVVVCPSPNLGDDFDWCNETSHTLTATNQNPAYSYTWLVDGQVVAGNGRTFDATGPGEYAVIVSADQCDDESDTLVISSDFIPEVMGDTICKAGVAELSATASQTIYWYDAMTGGNLEHTGDMFSPDITQTTTYYAQGGESSTNYATGHTAFSRVWADAPNSERKLKFVVVEELTINSVTFEASGAQTVNVRILESDNSTIINQYSKPTTGGVDQIQVGITLQPGTYYMDGFGTTGSLYIDNTVASYDDAGINGLITFSPEPSWEANNSRWRFFYNWDISVGSACARVPVEAVIDPNNVECLITGTDPDASGQESLIAAYPNPTNGIINLTEEVEYTVFNAQGVIVTEGTGSSFDLTDQVAGFYMLRTEFGMVQVVKE